MIRKRFRVEIELGNDAMLTGADLAQALAKVGDVLRHYADLPVGLALNIKDANGNTVGRWRVTS